MKLRSCVGDLSVKRRDEIEEKRYANKIVEKKGSALSQKYNLRALNISDNERKSSLQNLKTLSKGNKKNEYKVANCARKLNIQGKENKITKRSKTAVSSNCSSKIKSSLSASPITCQGNITSTFEDRKKITGIINIKNSRGKGISHIKNVNKKVPLCEIPNNCLINGSDLKNRFINNVDVTTQQIVKHTSKLPVWKMESNINKTKRNRKRKSFVDVYDISQDEDMSSETKHKKMKINSVKNVKRCVNKNKCFISNKDANFSQKNSRTSKLVQKRINKLAGNHPSNGISSNPSAVKVNTIALPSYKVSEILTASIVVENDHICANSVEDMHTASECGESNNIPANRKSQEVSKILTSSIVEENDQNCAENINVTSEPKESNNISTNTKSQQEAKNFLLNLADELENSLLIPRMTSTPDSTLLINPVTKHPHNNKLPVLNISSIIPKSKTRLKIPVTFCNSFHDKETEITLFESPVKKTQKKNPVKVKSPKKNIQITLFQNFTEQPIVDNLENSVLQPKKAYHSPDNFKSHLARTKRISEVMKKEAKKSKEEIMIEKMVQHFDEISSTELCVE